MCVNVRMKDHDLVGVVPLGSHAYVRGKSWIAERGASFGGGGEVNETPLAQIIQWRPSLSTL
jgi:hypothetical protein